MASGTPTALAMLVTKPNPRPYAHYRATPEPPRFPLGADACPPRFPLVTYSCLTSPHCRFGFCLPVQQSTQPVLRKGVVLAAPLHGRPPHTFTAPASGPCGEGKCMAGGAMLPAASVPTQVPAAQQKTKRRRRSRSQAKAPRPRKAAVPRTRLAAWHGDKLKPSELGEASTIMLRNIPKKIRSEDVMKLLDEHCSRVNRAAGDVIAAYDVVYLPMHFRKEVNFGYALINFTTSAAANGLYYSLQNCGWNEQYDSKKTIKIYPAKQQGKAKLLQHLEKLMLKLKCDNDEFLPAELSPPRDGVNVPAAPMRIRCRSRKQYGSKNVIGIDHATQQLQFFIKLWNGVSRLIQIDTAKVSVGSLIESNCNKLGMQSVDAFAVFEGKCLDDDEYLSNYSIGHDSIVEIRLRLRAGRIVITFDQQFNMPEAEMFYDVQLPPSVQKQGDPVPISSVKFFSYKSVCYLHELLKFVTGTHRDGWSFNGDFESRDIIWEDGRVYIMCTEVLFNEQSCRKDFHRLYEILEAKFLPYGLPMYFKHLLEYLKTCPAGRYSNTEALIGFVTNHPCLQHYTDRMRQVMVLAIMFPRLNPVDRQSLRAALGSYSDWAETHVHGVPDMDRVYYHFHTIGADGSLNVNPMYNDTPEGAIHYSNNYMKHAELQVWTEAMEAAYCLHFGDFFPEMLLRMACSLLYQREWVTDVLADKRSKERRN